MDELKVSKETMAIICDVLQDVFKENARLACTGSGDESKIEQLIEPVREPLRNEGYEEESSYDSDALYHFLKAIYFKPLERAFG